MRLTFLGTGPAISIPRRGHRDAACSDARRPGSKSRRTRSAALLETKDAVLLIDAGPDILSQLTRARVRRIDAVLLTHGHADASGGLRQLSRWLALRDSGRVIPVFTDATTKRRLKQKYKRLTHLRFIAVRPFSRIRAGRLRIIPFPVRHAATPGFPTFGFYFGKSLAYVSDAASLPDKSARLLRRVRTLVLDGAAWFGIRIPTHLSTDAAIRLAGDLRAHHVILTQIGHSYPPHKQAETGMKHFFTVLHDLKPRRISLAYDGLLITL